MYYIQETDRPTKWLKRIKFRDNKIILPTAEEEISMKQAQKLALKTQKLLEKTNCKKIVLSKKIKNQKQYKNYLNTYGFDIADGKWLFEMLSTEILEYIIQKKDLKKEETTISVLVNQITETTYENIKIIAKQYKRVNVVTNHIDKLKKMEEQILENDGIMITVTNNKKKSLLKADIILNVDFPTELINQYQIKDNAIIVNIQGNVQIKKKRFNGICINNYEIKQLKDSEIDNSNDIFSNKDIYEANMYKKQPVHEVLKKIKKDNIEIFWLQGVKDKF